MKICGLLVTLAITGLLGTVVLSAQEDAARGQAELAASLNAAKVSLQQALSAGASKGKPISGKFEVEGGKLQLSVYTVKGNKFFEVIVDHTNGAIAKSEEITSGDDLTAAQAQSKAMANAKLSLTEATAKATSTNEGYRAVSSVPTIKDGHPVAEITLAKGNDFKSVSEKLD